MGVSGAGKSLVGRLLAERLQWTFLDADDFHPDPNILKMQGGVPLEPADRVAWLQALRTALGGVTRGGAHAVLACSALQERFRLDLRAGFDDVRFVYLRVDRETARARVGARPGHFMPASLVNSQFETLEAPRDAIVVDATAAPGAIVESVAERLAPPRPA